MTFPKQQNATPSSIGAITVTLFDPDPLQPTGGGLLVLTQSANAEIDVLMSDGSHKVYRADIAEHFPTATINQLKAFVASVRTKSIAEILP